MAVTGLMQWTLSLANCNRVSYVEWLLHLVLEPWLPDVAVGCFWICVSVGCNAVISTVIFGKVLTEIGSLLTSQEQCYTISCLATKVIAHCMPPALPPQGVPVCTNFTILNQPGATPIIAQYLHCLHLQQQWQVCVYVCVILGVVQCVCKYTFYRCS